MAKLLDSNIVIYFLNDYPSELFDVLRGDVILSVLSRMEVLAGTPLEKHQETITFLDTLPTLPITPAIADRAGVILREIPSLRKRQPDALIGATALVHNLTFLTANAKDFRKIPNLNLEIYHP